MKKEKLTAAGQILEIPVDRLNVNPLRARIYYNEAETKRLMNSIREFGILEPLTVVAAAGGKYVLVSGERRFRAALELGYTKLPCVLNDGAGETSLFMMLSGEITALRLSYFETALCYEKLHDRFHLTYAEIAERLGIETGEVLSKVRLLQIPAPLRKQMIENALGESYARILLPLTDEDKASLLREIEKERLSLFDAKRRAKEYFKRKENGELKVVTFFKDSIIFQNTIENAVGRMQTAGIDAQYDKDETAEAVEYRIRIAK